MIQFDLVMVNLRLKPLLAVIFELGLGFEYQVDMEMFWPLRSGVPY